MSYKFNDIKKYNDIKKFMLIYNKCLSEQDNNNYIIMYCNY